MTDPAQTLARARALLTPEPVRESALPALGAAALAAVAALMMAGVVVLGPGVTFDDPAIDRR